MYISPGWRDKELSLSLSEEKTNLHGLYLEPALNIEMVRAVRTEHQTSDCDVKCRITFISKGNYCYRMWHIIVCTFRATKLAWILYSHKIEFVVYTCIDFILLVYKLSKNSASPSSLMPFSVIRSFPIPC